MTKPTTSKFVAAAVGFTLALTVFVGVGATTAAAQAMSLSDLVNLFISLGIISPDKADAARAAVSSSTTTSGYTYTRDLTIGSTGADVTALQTALGVTPTSGYFGNITKAAVASYQASKGLPSTGYFGPLTRAEINKTSTVVTTPGTTTTTPVVNTGVEGTLTVEKASISNSTIYEGASMAPVLGIKTQARLSDITVQRVRVNLGTDTTVYTRAFNTMYLTDDTGKVLAQADLNSNTVVKDGSNYILTFSGFNYTVPRDTTKYLWVKADAAGSFRTSGTGNCASTAASCSIALANDGVRAVDGAGFDLYSPTTGSDVTQTLSLQTSLIDSATLDVSLAASNVKATDVVADQGSNSDELDQLPVLLFDLRANKDRLLVTDLAVAVTASADISIPTVYLYDGSNLLQTESLTGNAATFNDIDIDLAKDETKTLTVKVDVRGAETTRSTIVASASSTSAVAENSLGSGVTESGSATGETIGVRSVGPVFVLNSITTGSVTRANETIATSTVAYTFNLSVTAKGGNVTFGQSGSAYALASSTGVQLYRNESSVSVPSGMLVTAFYSTPSSGVTTQGSGAFLLSKGNTVTVPITVELKAASSTTQGSYSVGISALSWGVDYAATTTSTFMSGKNEWRSANVTLP